MGGSLASKCPTLTGAAWFNCQADGNLEAFKKHLTFGLEKDLLDDYFQFLQECVEGRSDPDLGVACINQDTIGTLDGRATFGYLSLAPDTWGQKVAWNTVNAANVNSFNLSSLYFYAMLRYRLKKLCAPVDWNDVWPSFYHMANSPKGRESLEDLFSKYPNLPDKCKQALLNNYKEDVQRQYCLLNTPDYRTQLHLTVYTFTNSDPDAIFNDANMNAYLVLSIADSKWANENRIFGNPLWKHKDRVDAFSRVIGKDIATGKNFIDEWAQSYVDLGFADVGKSAVDYFDPLKHPGTKNFTDDADYAGLLPYAPPYAVQGEPYHLATTDPAGYGYRNTCFDKSEMDVLMPIVGGVVGSAVGFMFMPGTSAKYLAAGTLGSAAYSIVSDTLGYDALVAKVQNRSDNNKIGAEILSIGVPVTLLQSMWEIGLIPETYRNTQNQVLLLSGGAVAGYFLLLPVLAPVLKLAGTGVSILTAPIAGLERLVQIIGNGCLAHDFTLHSVCDCEQAATKPGLAGALVGEIFGCTEKQLELRNQSLQAAMTNGSWGKDPYKMGNCDDKGHLDTPEACISAGEWAYQNWPKEIPRAQQMYNEIAHVFEADNKSFLPPIEADKPCLQHGKYFRMIDGTCQDKRAPVGMQEPGQYVWPDENQVAKNESCAIL